MDQTTTTKEEGHPGYSVEEMPRHGRTIMVIYRGSEAVGQFSFTDKKDVDLWNSLITAANEAFRASRP